jgi:hypothetical protein
MKIRDIPKSGRCGQVVAFQSRYGLCLREMVIPRNISTPARQRVRAIFGSNSRMWSARLTQEQRDRWSAAGSQAMTHPRLGDYGPMTGQQFWQSISNVRAVVGLPPDAEPPAPVSFDPSPIGPLTIENTGAGVRLWLAAASAPGEAIMLFGQQPCSAGRHKRRNVCYLGLLPPPIGNRIEITALYKARFGEPRPNQKVFILTCQTKNGWKSMDRVTSALVPPPSPSSQAILTPPPSQCIHMHTGGSPAGQRVGTLVPSDSPRPDEPATGHGTAAGEAAKGGDGVAGSVAPP